ncbi:uncharacterized protein Z519_10549 [Cladophialophora bantiana CBS 173.52]|uniref:Zn(2)-C6 fungal-type domain-containing protein n=1 Tax=Cladophialophora bantiana (strain ATCC 10958 / CBS 173.52 / CDC B-1940 / NIH 8579) TaxID=1442370 RepID=A0A0D2HWX9_CLAB1|nr:uncharacterized protein Z519_10549 [Cladophialophora bantiana CBS 173.52]KIW89064.1 hypothetical protein Z519_10549 [Cladophialophora bantiana CBS 173.52]
MASLSQQGSYSSSQPQDASNAYKYEDPTAYQIPSGYPTNQFEVPLPVARAEPESQAREPPKPQSSASSEPKVRLRKACDSCSVRKVKCDETGPPCKSCAALDIPCTFDRPSRRRGPPNRHAEAIKRQKLEGGNFDGSRSSPTHDAAYSLAALAAPTPLSAESICDLPALKILLDDYFTYIHPLIPLPHEPTFRRSFEAREDRTNHNFLALIAAMVECLVASFPRRPRQLFTTEPGKSQFPNAGALIDRCHQVFVEARGLGYMDRPMNLYDGIASYLTGLAAGYVLDIPRMRLYLGECTIIMRELQFHRPEIHRPGAPPAAPYGPADVPRPPIVDYIYQESGRRLFWLLFVGAMSARQLDEAEGDLLMPPVSHAEMLPPLPVEVDDEYITETQIFPQPRGVVSEMVGFNLNVKVFRAFHFLAALEMAFGANNVYDWDRQRQIIRRALQNVKDATRDAPKELQLNPANGFGEWPPTQADISAYSHLFNDREGSEGDLHATPGSVRGSFSVPSKRAIQFEIQKANIYATQLSSRSYLVERFWNLYEIVDRDKLTFPSDKSVTSSSPTAGIVTTGMEHGYRQIVGRTPSDSMMDTGEQMMAVEREDIVRDMALLLKSINQVNMEPNGMSFCNKIRTVASTLLETKRARMSVMPTLDSESVNAYLHVFLDILSKLERLGPGRFRGVADGNTGGLLRTAEEIEDEELIHWASLKEHQERFVRTSGFW